jgi:glycosyltransferase involved in cell wall biosynthesis
MASVESETTSVRADTKVSREVSVAIATYNGAEFLETQLASIAAQSRRPIEVVVCDDGSTDETVELVERFAREAPFDVRLVRNQENLGFGENFMKAGRLCRGELVAWCDQDDYWMPQKLARCVEQFEQDQDVMLVVHSAQVAEGATPRFAGGLGRYHKSWRSEERILRRHSHYTPDSLPLEISAFGHSSVVSRRVLDVGDALASTVSGVFSEFSGHDTWTSFLAAAIGKVVLLPDVLVKYRQHRSQVAGATLRQGLAARVKQSRQGVLVERLEAETTRAFFRGSVLAALAAQFDTEAGFARDAPLFRAALDAQLAAGGEVGFGRGTFDRAVMWRRRGEILQRRLELWRQRPGSKEAAAHLVRNVRSRDYGKAERGNLGLKLLAQDLLHVAPVAGRRNASQ